MQVCCHGVQSLASLVDTADISWRIRLLLKLLFLLSDQHEIPSG